MKTYETAGDFYHRHGKDYRDAGQFNVYRIEDFSQKITIPYNRRDFYKVCLVIKGEGVMSYADKVIPIKDNALTFTNPMIPYSWKGNSDQQSGYFCMFTEEFINHHLKAESLSTSPLFKVSGNHVLYPEQKTVTFLTSLFEQMLAEMDAGYVNRYELLRSYVQIIIHEAMKIEPPDTAYKSGTSNVRISTLFLELLDRQFPIATPQHKVFLKNANEFARQLAVHTNHLNRALKEVTGKTTTAHIAEKMAKEARDLLLHSSWDIAEIGYCLGFEYASNFNIFFKRQTGQTPNHFRKQAVVTL